MGSALKTSTVPLTHRGNIRSPNSPPLSLLLRKPPLTSPRLNFCVRGLGPSSTRRSPQEIRLRSGLRTGNAPNEGPGTESRTAPTSSFAASNRNNTRARASSSSGSRALGSRSRKDLIEFSANLETNIAIRQHSQATFDDYLAHTDRVFGAFFPDRQRCSKVGKHTWRISMLPLDFFLLTVRPVVDMDIFLDPQPNRVKYTGARSVIHLNSRDFELHGVEYNKADFILSLAGTLYATRSSLHGPRQTAATSAQAASRGQYASSVASSASSTPTPLRASSAFSSSQSSSSSNSSVPAWSYSSNVATPPTSVPDAAPASVRAPAAPSQGHGLGPQVVSSVLRGRMSASVATAAPGILAALPPGTIASVGNAVLSRLLSAMKDNVNERVLDDYKAFVKERTGAQL